MIFPDDRAILALDAFARDTRADDFRQPIEVERIDAHALLDLGAHHLGPRLCAEDPDPQRAFARVQALTAEFLGDAEHVGRRHHDDVGFEVGDQLHLPLRLPA